MERRMPNIRQQSTLAFLMLFMALAPAVRAQIAINSIANQEAVPLRNLQIEVRQQRDGSQARSALGAKGGVQLQPGGSGATLNITGHNSQRSDTRDLVQRVLVLNGRNVNINLGNSVPLRLMQAFVQNGAVRYLGGSVLVNANSGFAARPLWRGGDSAELELAAMQSTRSNSTLPAASVSSSSTSTALTLPLGEWVTVAQSEDAAAGSSSGTLNSGQSASREGLRVEVRISLR